MSPGDLAFWLPKWLIGAAILLAVWVIFDLYAPPPE